MKTLQNILFIAFLLSLFTACVPSRKYNDLQKESYRNKRQSDSLRSIVDKNRYLQFDIKRLEAQAKKDKEAMEELNVRVQSLGQSHQDLTYRYDQLLAQNGDLLSTTSTEKQTLTEELSAKQMELDQKERALRRLEESLKSQESSLSNVSGQFEEYERQVKELNALIKDKENKLLALRQKVNQALLGFSDSDLSVSEKNGKIYVSLSQNLLFARGSDDIDWKGKKAIIQVAQVLKNNPDISINVEGHTDADGSADRNWDLSVARATAVVKVLTGQGVDPKRIYASGRALYDPVSPNSSADSKAKNRRTEIILTPNLDELYKVINQ